MADAQDKIDELNAPGVEPAPHEQPSEDAKYDRFTWQPGDVVWLDENGEPEESENDA